MALFGITFLGLWWFQQQMVRPFIDQQDDQRWWQAQPTESLLLPLLQQADINTSASKDQSAPVILMHFWNPDCFCNQVSQRHFASLIRQFSAEELRIIAIAPKHISQQEIASFQRLNGKRIELLPVPESISLPLASSPGLALFHKIGDGEYRLGYFGPYGFGALCTLANDGFFPEMIRAMMQGPYGPFVNVVGEGCYCPWTKH